MELPNVSPVGVSEVPAGYRSSPRRHPRAVRGMALLILLTFTAVGTATTVLSLGAWCLTSQAAGGPSPVGR